MSNFKGSLRPSRCSRVLGSKRARRGFTLIELLVSISIIGILAGLALGGMYRANVSAKQFNTKTTVNKVAVQISEIWESYNNSVRKLPFNAQQVLGSNGNAPFTVQYANAQTWLAYFSTIRTTAGLNAIYPDNTVPPTNNGLNPNNKLQVAALQLAARRELMRLELPSSFQDFLTPASTNPPDSTPSANYTPVRTLLIPQPMNGNTPLANPGGLSEQYRQFFIANATTYNEQYQNAECLYLILKFASQNEMGQKNLTDDPRLVGDVDGDGMPEIQDAFNASTYTPPQPGSPYTQHNNPISFLRWPAGFFSDFQRGALPGQTQAEYAAMFHDIYDPLRIDPRAFNLVPLVYSAGANGSYGLWDWKIMWWSQSPPSAQNLFIINDPYWSDGTHPLLGTQMDYGTPSPATGTGDHLDNITNHLLSTNRE